MADILAVGITHYPPLSGRDESMSWILKRMLENPKLPEKLRHSENWPEAMRKEWSTDEGVAAARVHREQLRQSLRRTRAQIDEFRPEFIVIWGDDQYENFREDVVPPYCIYAHESFNTARCRTTSGMSRRTRSIIRPAKSMRQSTSRAA